MSESTVKSIRSSIVTACLCHGVYSPNEMIDIIAEAANGITTMSIAGVKAHITRSGVAYKAAKAKANSPRPEPKGTRLC